MRRLGICMMATLIFGCTPKRVVTYNLKHSGYRSAGDIAVTVLLDQTDVDKAEVLRFCRAAIAFLESGATTKRLFQETIRELAPVAFTDYIDALFVVVPNSVDMNEEIPPDVREGLLSFLRDGAVRAIGLYKEEHHPNNEPDSS